MIMLKRKPNAFEAILLVIGVALILVGYMAIHKMVLVDSVLSWDLLQTTFLWLVMILLVIMVAVNENMKEELKLVIQNQLEEIKVLRQDLNNHAKKINFLSPSIKKKR